MAPGAFPAAVFFLEAMGLRVFRDRADEADQVFGWPAARDPFGDVLGGDRRQAGLFGGELFGDCLGDLEGGQGFDFSALIGAAPSSSNFRRCCCWNTLS